MRNKTFGLTLIATAMILSGCTTLAPEYERPAAPIAQAWPQDLATKNVRVLTNGLAQWGEFFQDERLRSLIQQGLENNRDLRVSALNVEKARALYNVSRGQLLPSVAAVADEAAKGTPAEFSSSGQRTTTHVYTASAAMASYELDLFGRVRNLNEQALQQYMATEAAQRTAQMTVITEIAQTWLGLGAAKAQKALALETLNSQEKSRELIEKSYELGAASQLDVQQVLTTVASAKAAYVQATRTVSQYRNALTLLVGSAVDPALEPEGIVSNAAAQVSALSGVPSEVLLARPDIAAAEAALKAANANIGVARAAFFPRIALTAAVGTTSAELSNLFDAGTRFWSFAPQISLPIFTGGQNTQNLKAAQAEQKAAVASYERAIQSAFREVADALAIEGTVSEELKARQELAQATEASYRLAQARYQNGADSYFQVLDSQRTHFSAQQALISAQLAQVASRVTLYKVMGGGSQLNDGKN